MKYDYFNIIVDEINTVNLINNANLAVSMGIGLNHMNVFLMDNGMQLIFEDGKRPQIIPNEVNKINIAPILVDGKGLSKVGEEIIQERLGKAKRELGLKKYYQFDVINDTVDNASRKIINLIKLKIAANKE